VTNINGQRGRSTRGRLKRITSLVLLWAMPKASKKIVMGEPKWLLQKEKKKQGHCGGSLF
jgi:hypothetical protein